MNPGGSGAQLAGRSSPALAGRQHPATGHNHPATEHKHDFAPRQVFGGTDYPYAIMETQLHQFLTDAEPDDSASLFNGAAKRFLGLT